MPLTKPSPAPAIPGAPITAQAWNAIVGGLSDLYDAVLALGGGTVAVTVSGPGSAAVPNARVVATPAGEGNPVEAIAPFAGSPNYLLVGLGSGVWHVSASAPGFTAVTTDVTAPAADPVLVILTTPLVTLPDLFGVAALQAVTHLSGLNIQVDTILDITGTEVPRVNMPLVNQNSPFLAQFPAPGAAVDPVAYRVHLVVAAAIATQETVTMPSLIGLTYSEVTSVLNRLGLAVGASRSRQAASG
jgi:hypothetical protein